jgi:acyl transferase domain-containing protein
LAHLNFLSPDNRCFSFDHRANGYSRGEGSGIIVIKRLSAAIEDGDTIRAVIRASGSNENGRSAGAITRVSKVVQEDLVHETYARGGLSLKETRYVEAHAPGTGGDEVETAALAAVFGKHRNSRDPLCLGSVKANIGHLEGGSGMASLIKTVLMLERGIMPRLANFEDANPKIQTEAWNLKVCQGI